VTRKYANAWCAWVRELVQPIKEAALKTEHAITSLAVRFESLFASHDKLIQDRSDREREDHLKSNLTYTIREKWAPIVGFLLAVVALFGTVASGFAWWFVHYVLPNAK